MSTSEKELSASEQRELNRIAVKGVRNHDQGESYGPSLRPITARKRAQRAFRAARKNNR